MLLLDAGLDYNSICSDEPALARAAGYNCSDVPPPLSITVAVILVVVGIVTLAPWWLRWLTDSKPPEDS